VASPLVMSCLTTSTTVPEGIANPSDTAPSDGGM
jgi:hypothetical protein